MLVERKELGGVTDKLTSQGAAPHVECPPVNSKDGMTLHDIPGVALGRAYIQWIEAPCASVRLVTKTTFALRDLEAGRLKPSYCYT